VGGQTSSCLAWQWWTQLLALTIPFDAGVASLVPTFSASAVEPIANLHPSPVVESGAEKLMTLAKARVEYRARLR
jgi:hypothetical protein